MNEKTYTRTEIVAMSDNEYETFISCVQARAYGLLGMNWEKWIGVIQDPITGNITFRWE